KVEPAAGNLVVGKDGLALHGQVLAADPKVRVANGLFGGTDFPAKMYTVDLSAGRRYHVKLDTVGEAVVMVRNKTGRTLALEKGATGAVDFPIDILTDGPHRIVVALSRAGKFSLNLREEEVLIVHDAAQDLRFHGEIGKTASVSYMVKAAAGKNYVID